MAIHVALNHKTIYQYDRLVSLRPHTVRLRPAPHARTPIVAYSMKVTPQNHFCNWQQDPQGNYLARLVFPNKMREFRVEVEVLADLTIVNPFDFFLDPAAERFPIEYPAELGHDIAPYRRRIAETPRFAEYLARIDRTPQHVIDFLVELNQRVQGSVEYLIRHDPGVQTCEQTLDRGSGSCRDSAWLLVQLLRHVGFAARFVSGYLIQLKPDVPSLDGPSGPEADFTDLHAWAEVYLPGAGWIGLDATSGLLAGEGHIPLACSADPQGASPIAGNLDECDVEFRHEMRVTRVHEDPRVTKPYTDREWEAIDALGRKIDEDLEAADVRLTIGGEPTFVSIDDMEGEEWTTAALGAAKRARAEELIHRLRTRLAPRGLLHFGQGKWYPGEPLPRWALGCYWRDDGEPLWGTDDLLADGTSDYGHDAKTADRFIRALAARLDVDPEHAEAGFEDVLYYLWKERRLPDNVDPFDSKLDDPSERARLAQVLESGLDREVGYALPIHHGGAAGWRSARWRFRGDRMFLMPGDSPMGYRLPLDSLPWMEPEARQPVDPPDPLIARPPLPKAIPGSAPAATPGMARPVPAGAAEDDDPVRTALCVEPREGRLHVFLPPVARLEHFLELVAAVEATARRLKTPVVVEGYAPPRDPRLREFKITPDPGVLEVNVPPAASWDELTANTTVLYDEARLSRLGTEKFMVDGRHTGTGGGNHVVIGGPTPADSPILRRPDLLKSLIGYWHNHPALSYVFSGMFVGPTSQAPRVEEARVDATYELDIAFRQVPQGEQVPWLVDRLFRHLLVDVVGNTHRAEFCIDKLYSPDGPMGRLGLVEFRAFEMPPHARMSLTQQLLLRALIARFWNHPYQVPLVEWGSALYDRWALPHFLEQDLGDVIEETRRFGYGLDAKWFGPHVEFRFPPLGRVERHGVLLELRQAVEPWYVLGEEQAGGGTARYVDSSVERVQLRVAGLTGDRHVVTCNGHRVPLHPTGTDGEYVAGVRFRAWQPPSCLHPTIPVHAPLVFDLVDTWLERSIGGCTYHVSHPGGRAYETPPVNAYEAEGRRTARFFSIGHTPGPLAPGPVVRHPRYPMTLDLRRVDSPS